MPTHKPTELSRINLKTWTHQPVPMMREHSSHLTSLPFGFRTWLWRYACLLLIISMLWHRQAIFESKGDKLSSFAECRIRTWKSQDTYLSADWMPTYKPTKLSRIKLNTWTQQSVPMISEHSAHLTSLPLGYRTWLWRYTCLLLKCIIFLYLYVTHWFRWRHVHYPLIQTALEALQTSSFYLLPSINHTSKL